MRPRRRTPLIAAFLLLLCAALALPALAEAPPRPEGDLERDADRKPKQLLDFFGIAPGMRVVELQATRGYYVELLAERVGAEGEVIAQNNSYVLNRFAEKPLSERMNRLTQAGVANVTRHDAELDELALPKSLDAALFIRFYHDLYWLPTPDGDKANRPKFLQQVFQSLKPGGVFGVIDHHAEAGSGARDALDPREGLHRVDIETVKREILDAGFILDAESDLLRDESDSRDWNIFVDSGSRRDKTDRFVLRFIKPKDLTRHAPLPPTIPWDGASAALVVAADDPWITPSEKSGLRETPRYEETHAWLEKLVAASSKLRWVTIGTSDEGRAIRMIIASREGARTVEQLKKNGRPTLFAHAGIHSGEIDGKDAGMMLLRDMTVGGRESALLEAANFLFIPILSVDAHERFSPHSRINQRGPAEMGWRTNRRNLNLNRDFSKLETKEVRALAAAVHAWQPDLYLDLHVTDGVDYQYDITYGYNGDYGWSPAISRWLNEQFTPTIQRELTEAGHIPGPLVFQLNGNDLAAGNLVWTAGPRFSNGWGDLRHLPTVLVENHSLKPYRQRVLGTYIFLKSAMQLLGREGDSLREATRKDRDTQPDEVALGWRFDRDRPPTPTPFLGIRSERYLSPITGTTAVRWTGEPIEGDVPFFFMSAPTKKVRRPSHYYIPAAWGGIADKLRAQGVAVEQIDAPLTLKVERYRLPEASLDGDSSPFEGRMLFKPGELTIESVQQTLPAGSYRVATDGELGSLVTVLLEPEAPDSFFQWGYFASIMQRTEYVEGYVMEPLAQAMLDGDAELRSAFEAKLASDAEFAADARARLQWFYKKTPYFDEEHRLYPILRSVD